MSTQLQVGPLRIATLDPSNNGNKTGIYILPSPENKGINLEWILKSSEQTLIDGSERTRLLGWIPELRVKWSIYDDVNTHYGYPIGSANGNLLDYVSLLSILDTPPGLLKISPGLAAGGFVVNKVVVGSVGVIVGGFTTGVEITFRGRDICATKSLGAY